MWFYFSAIKMVNMGLHEERRKRDQEYTPVRVTSRKYQTNNAPSSMFI